MLSGQQKRIVISVGLCFLGAIVLLFKPIPTLAEPTLAEELSSREKSKAKEFFDEEEINLPQDLEQRKARFMLRCERRETNAQCEKFYESLVNPKRSLEYCKTNPDDAGCLERAKEAEKEKEKLAKISAEKELREFCQENPHSERCATRRTSMKRHKAARSIYLD